MAAPPVALSVQPITNNPLEEYGRAVQLKGALQQQQIQTQQLKDQQALTAAMKDWDPSSGDYGSLVKSTLANGGSGNAALQIQQHAIDVQKQREQLTQEQRDNYVKNAKSFGDLLQGVENVPDEQLASHAMNTVLSARNAHLIDDNEANQYLLEIQRAPNAAGLRSGIDSVAKLKQGAAAVMAQKKTEAETTEATAKGREANANAKIKEIEAKGLEGITPDYISQQVDSIYDPNGDAQTGGQNRLVKSQALGALQRGDVQGAKQILTDAYKSQLEEKKTIATETNPAVQASKLALAKAEKAAEQAIADGDPKAAAQLLVSGAVAPSQLVSSRKPAFAQQAFTAARELDPNWNATKADADYNVAKSPNNLAFFGSAKSLTDKGGTLDQLKDAAKDIPEHKLPVFNTVDDWIKASTGSGPIAKYAALALGVADDYSKVMGGGQGSDTSRSQALHLIGAQQSPEQKAASLEGIRGAVNSQKNSRIGNNSILRNMYGDEPTETKKTSSQGSPTTAEQWFNKHGGRPSTTNQ